MRSSLAIEGGKPVRGQYLPYGRHLIDEEDIAAVERVLRSDWLTTGPKVAEFEEAFAACVGSKYAVAMSSGTAALHGAIFATGLGSGDEVITTPLTFAATANCVLYQGARPVFADVQQNSLNIDPEKIKGKINSHTKAIIPVDYAGQPADLDEINEIASRHGFVVIEDAAHALGAVYRGKKVGSLAKMTVFSTHPVKHITTGEGGIVTTDDPEIAKRLKIFRNHGITTEGKERQENGEWFYQMVALGYNYRLTDIQCALGLNQLKKLKIRLEQRRSIAEIYNRAFKEMPELEIPHSLPDRESAWHLYIIRLNLQKLRVKRAEIFKALRAENIGVNVHYIPVYLHPFYRQQLGMITGLCPLAEQAYDRILSLPIFSSMKDKDVKDVIQAVRKVIRFFKNEPSVHS